MESQREAADYLEVLSRLHRFLRPKTYFEIGTLSGRSLELARCSTIAVDPHFAFDRDVFAGKQSCFLFQMTSDEFFSRYSPRELLGCQIEMAFLDGMHLAEFILRDFIQVEMSAKRNSVIVLHDCFPANVQMTSRAHEPGTAWTGDVWKILPVLAKFRPEIRIHALDSPPTGLAICTNLDSSSRTLEESYSDILEEMASMKLTDSELHRLRERFKLSGTESTRTFEAISQRYWL